MSMGRLRVLLSAALLAAMIGITGMRDAGDVLPVRTVPVGAIPILAAVDEQTGRAFVVDWAGPAAPASVSVLDTATGTLLRTVAIGINPRAAAVDRRAGRVFVLNEGAYPAPGHGSISVLDALIGQVLRTVTIGAFPPLQGGVVVDEASGRAFTISSAAHGGLVSVIDSRSGRVARRVRVAGEPTALGVDLSAGHVFVGWVAADDTGHGTCSTQRAGTSYAPSPSTRPRGPWPLMHAPGAWSSSRLPVSVCSIAGPAPLYARHR